MRLTPALVDAYVAAAATRCCGSTSRPTLLSAFFRASAAGCPRSRFRRRVRLCVLRRKRLLEFALAEIGISA
jgi:hypothetical protein